VAAASSLKTLPGHVPAVVKQLVAKGNLPTANRLNLAIGVTLRDSKGLEDFLAQLYDPTSPRYRQYLTPEQFASEFGPTESDYAAVRNFARLNNLIVTALHTNRLLLDVSGSVEDIQKAFHITLRTYSHPTQKRDFYATDAEPSVDASLPISDISGLNNYVLPHPKSLHIDSSPSTNAVARTGSGSGGAYIGKDFRAAYLPGATLTGSGQIVGLLEFDGYYASDISAYEATAGYASVPLQTVLLDGYNGTPTTGPHSGNGEVSLDIEMAVAMAPGLSKIVVFEGGPDGLQNDILSAMAASNQIKQLSCSWGWGGGPSATTDNIFKEMATQGQSFFVAVGDSDAFTVGSSSVKGVDNTSLDNAPSSCPYITVVGGTTLSTTGPGGSWSSETTWNWGLDDGSYVGTSGGVSSYYSIPTWQEGISMSANGGSTTYRNIPDVALTADNVYVAYGDGSSATFGGTSCATPLWAALVALMNQQAASTGASMAGFINPAIYAIGKGTSYSLTFHDITTGNNTSSSSPSNYYAVAGYDLCTGWGTPMGQSLINVVVGPPDSLDITPSVGFTASGAVGGPFSPTTQTFVLTNTKSSSLTWSIVNSASWLEAVPTNGVLAAHAVTNVTVDLSFGANDLDAGIYRTNLVFTNWSTHIAQNESFGLQIGQSLVENGGFETGDFTGWTLVGDTIVNSGRGQVTIYDAVENASSGFEVVHSGTYGAFLGDGQLATLSQTLASVAGQNYLISFWLDNPVSGSGQQFLVNWSGDTLYDNSSPPAFTWTNFQFVVVASGTNSILQFGAENDPSYFGLDDVSVTPVPTVAFRTAVASANSFSLRWSTASGLTYQVQYKTNLLQANWIDLGTPIVATGTSLTISDTNSVKSSLQRFYRLVVSP
jgi:subtilase family serine protease